MFVRKFKSIALSLLYASAVLMGCNAKHPAPQSGYIQAGKLRIYYERVGRGKPLLLLHAGFQDHRMWKQQVDELQDDFETIALDLPGHGNSQGKDTLYRVSDWLAVVLDSLHITKACVAGVSMGSGVAVEFSLHHPERVEALAMISPALPGWEERFPVDTLTLNWFRDMMHQLELHDTLAAAQTFTRFWCDGVYRSKEETPSAVRSYVDSTTYNCMRRHRVEGWPRFNQIATSLDLLPKLRFPLLIITGSLDAPSCIAVADYLQKQIPHAQRANLQQAAHMVNMEKPDSVNLLLRRFISGRRF